MDDTGKKPTRERVQLNDRLVKGKKPGAVNYAIWDKEIQGLGVQVMPTGTKTFVWKYTFLGRQRWITIGSSEAWSVEAARQKAREYRQSVDNHIDPAGVIAADKANPLMPALAKKFLEEHCSKRKTSTKDDYEAIINAYILPALSKVQVKDITPAHVASIHAGMKDKPYRANRTLAVISSMLSLAETWGYRKPGTNPCGAIERYAEVKKTRYLNPEELGRLLETLQNQEVRYPYQVRLIRLLLLTGARLREISNCRWGERVGGDPLHPYLYLDGGCIHCEDHKGSRKGGPKDILLSKAALDVIKSLVSLRLGSPYLFPSPDDRKKPLANPHHAWLTIKANKTRGDKERKGIRDLAGLSDVRLHDLRHSFGTLSVSLNQNPAIRQKLLGHASAATTERYSHADIDPLRAAVEAIGEAISGMKKA